MTAPLLRTPQSAATYAPAAAPHHARTGETLGTFRLAMEALDDAHALLVDGAAADALDLLVAALRHAYDALPPDAWRALATEICLAHPITAALHEDPFTYRAFAKPRGYPGDAGILDLIYGEVPLPEGTTPTGAAVYACGVRSPASHSVQERRTILGDAIDAAAARANGAARVLSVACGHLREAQSCAAVRSGGVAAFHALDQDPISIDLLEREHRPLGVTPVLASVRDVIVRRVALSDLTLAYAAGLYDYLPTPVAARLTARLFDMLAPGGRLLVANFCPNLLDVGYMESFMAWSLIYRTEAEMREIAAEVPAGQVASQRTYRDGGGNVVYLEIERR